MLSIYDKVDIMKDKYKEASTIAESDFSINFGIYCNYKDDPKNIKYIDKINVNGFDYYVFKFSLTYTYNSSSEFLTNYIFNMVGMEKYNGKEITTWFSMEGDATCGSWDLYRHKAGFEYVETLEETLTYSISIDKLNDLYKSRIDIANWMRVLQQENFLLL